MLKSSPIFLSLLVALSSALLNGCSMQPQATAAANKPFRLNDPTYEDVLAVASKNQNQLIDGWFYGALPRVFKSAYNVTPPAIKAQFALDLENFLSARGENMVANWNSYVSYKQRADFAKQWWSAREHKSTFNEQTKKMKIVWIHDALMDGCELWWRAFESKNVDKLPDAAVYAHDAEQKLVYDYTDVQGRGRSFSEEYVRFAD